MINFLARFAACGIVLAALSSCGGGGAGVASTSAPVGVPVFQPAAVTVITGVVSDEIVVGATVTATSLDTGAVLGTAVTAANGSYAISTPTTSVGSGYMVASAGGTMSGSPFSGVLNAIYPINADSSKAT